MPGWHKAVADLARENKIALVGIIQEQHPDRARLFAQWHQIDWPILHDPLNLIPTRAVPRVVAIDEHGIVRNTRPRPDWVRHEFLATDYPAPDQIDAAQKRPDLEQLQAVARDSGSATDWRRFADNCVLWGGPRRISDAVDAYQQATKLASGDAVAQFGHGVALRMRYETASRQENDFAAAVAAWGRALDIDPNHYIYRRRIQQYGPRLIKPYPFYDWVEQARADISARGETPVPLAVEPGGAEIAAPAKSFATSEESAEEPDPQGRINRDTRNLIRISTVAVPARVKAGESVRLHLTLRPDKTAHWNNEAEAVRVWINATDGGRIDQQAHTLPLANKAESTEMRAGELEVQLPKTAKGNHVITGYALYYVCEEAGGTCLYLRQDFKVTVPVR